MNVSPWTCIYAGPWSNCVVLEVTEPYSFILFPLVDCVYVHVCVQVGGCGVGGGG